jgi:nucleotide-binding universal stress UspA family protein
MTHQSDLHIERVVVGIDFSEPSLRAARWVAQHFARGAELILVHVVYVPHATPSFTDRSAQRERLIETARAGAQVKLRQLGDSIATGLVWLEVRVGKPSEEIVRVATEYNADLVVVGQPEGRPGVWGCVGTTAQRVLRRSSVPVLVAREPSTTTSEDVNRQLLVAVDDSAMTTAVLDWGRYVTGRLSGEATVLHALENTHYSSIATPEGAPPWADLYTPRYGPPTVVTDIRDTERWLSERVRAVEGGDRMRPIVVGRLSSPAEVILTEAGLRNTELIVIGSRGAGAVPRLLFGSVAERVLLGASCSVLVVTSHPVDSHERTEAPSMSIGSEPRFDDSPIVRDGEGRIGHG